METPPTLSSLRSLNLDLPPSCIAFHPTLSDYFVVGTYFLHKEEDILPNAEEESSCDEGYGDGKGATTGQRRSGSLILMKFLHNNSEEDNDDEM